MAQFGGINLGGSSNEELTDAIIGLHRSLEYQMDGNLDSGNVREIGGWNVGITELMSTDMDVGMSTDDSTFNPVRFWAGGMDKNSAPWRVTQDGKMYAKGATIRSSETYPYLEFDSSQNLMSAYASPTNKMVVTTMGYSNPLPSLEFWSNAYGTSTPASYIFHSSDATQGLTLWSNQKLSFVASAGINLFGSMEIGNWTAIHVGSETLQQKLDNIIAKFG